MNKLLLALLLCVPFCSAQAAGPAEAKASSGGKLELYFEAMDNQGWQWMFLADVVRKRLDGAELKVYPLVVKAADGTFSAKRGEIEIAEATRIAVFNKFYPGKTLLFLQARSLSTAPEGWKDAALFCGVNPDEFERHVSSDGAAALADAYAKTSRAGITETTLLLDGRRYEGSPRLMPLYNAVNAALPAARRVPLPAGYKPAPKAPPPGFWVVLGQGMKKNDGLVNVFDKYFEDIKAVTLDYGDAERSKRFPWLEFVPAYVLDSTAESRVRLDNEIKAGLFKQKDGYLVYEDRQRSGLYAGRPAKPNTLELFVMSQCPYGVLAENAVLDAMQNKLFPEGLNLEIHFIGDAKPNAAGGYDFSSLHGQAEWEENARQIYVARKFPDKFKAYLLERNKDINSPDWQKAAKAAGVDAEKITAGFEEAKKLLAEDFKITDALGISTSPSFIVNGKEFMVGMGELAKVPGFEKLPEPGQPSAGCAGK
ncbi:MAG TPA: hypothetical protein DCZ92_11270 [Elusimicrobia bacterium]|nr:MAG: hypothetical protein A2016_07695 [Elusimicrobia bacterium GWF2_62_30]HBA61372.1 hypothetical protein [Elusimicrobiota bacterium]